MTSWHAGASASSTVFAEDTSRVTTETNNTWVDLGGPSVAITVPPSGLIEVRVRADITLGHPDSAGVLGVVDSGGLLAPAKGLFQGGSTFGGRVEGFWVSIELPPGPTVISMRYQGFHTSAPTSTVAFANRKLWVRPT